MAAQPVAIPFVPANALYDFTTTLEGTVYKFDVHWNEFESAWYFDVSDQFGSLIWAGIKIVIGCGLGGTSQDPRRPPGYFLAVDTTNANLSARDATFTDLGTRVVVLYYAAADTGVA